jgi:hypothetical protein
VTRSDDAVLAEARSPPFQACSPGESSGPSSERSRRAACDEGASEAEALAAREDFESLWYGPEATVSGETAGAVALLSAVLGSKRLIAGLEAVFAGVSGSASLGATVWAAEKGASGPLESWAAAGAADTPSGRGRAVPSAEKRERVSSAWGGSWAIAGAGSVGDGCWSNPSGSA